MRLGLQRDACGFGTRGDLIDVISSFDIKAHADALEPVAAFLAVVLTQTKTGLAGLEHRATQHAVVLPSILDLEAEPGEEIEALRQVVYRQARHHARALQRPCF